LAHRKDGTKDPHFEITVEKKLASISYQKFNHFLQLISNIIRHLDQIPIRIPRIHTLQLAHRTRPIHHFTLFQNLQTLLLQLGQNIGDGSGGYETQVRGTGFCEGGFGFEFSTCLV